VWKRGDGKVSETKGEEIVCPEVFEEVERKVCVRSEVLVMLLSEEYNVQCTLPIA